MKGPPIPWAQRLSSLAMLLLLVHVTPPARGDDAELRIADDCVIPLVRIDAGRFDMGRPSRGAFAAAAFSLGEDGDWATEGPVRRVTISRPFLIGKYKISAEQYCRFLNATDGPERAVSINRFANIENPDGLYRPKEGRETFPANGVHWDGAKGFCEWLSKRSGRTVRLPTEAEWEYVARGTEGRATPWESGGGTEWSSADGDSVDAFPDHSTPEGVVGLVDLRVGEWCSDYYGVRYRPEDFIDPKGPTVDQLPVASDLGWLSPIQGAYHVLRGRAKRPTWSTTVRSLGVNADNAGISGVRIVVETDADDDEP